MVKQKPGSKHSSKRVPPKTLSPYEQGLNAFRQYDFTRAIEIWGNPKLFEGKLPASDPPRREALAEAYFRRFLAAPIGGPAAGSLSDIEAACALSPQDGRYAYHLGLARHRLDRWSEAGEAYARAAELGFSPRRLAPVRAVLEIEQNQDLSPQVLSTLSDLERARLLPAAVLLQNRPQELLTATTKDLTAALQKLQQEPSTLALWQGLAEFALGQVGQASVTLAPHQKGAVLSQGAEAVRAYYHALALAAGGKEAEALPEIEQVARKSPFPALLDTLSLWTARQARVWIEEGKLDEASKLLDRIIPLLPGNKVLMPLLLQVLGRRVNEASGRGDWQQILRDGTRMYNVLQTDPDLGPLGSVIHNLAVAYEKIEDWENAAQKWNEIIALLPRRETQKPGKRFSPAARLAQTPPAEAKDWLRKRIILCYHNAGKLERAVDIYKKAVKQDPDDLALRMGLVDALLANEQWAAACNELGRIIEQDPQFIPARVHLAHLYSEDGKRESAETELRQALEIAPNDESVRKEMGTLLADIGDDQLGWKPGAARERYMEALQYRPDDVALMAQIGETSARMRDAEAARDWFERALKYATIDAFGIVFTSYLHLRDLANARKIVERFEVSAIQDAFSFFLMTGVMSFAQQTLPPLFASAAQAKPASSAPDWLGFGRELIERALHLESGPDLAERLQMVVSVLAEKNPPVALEYALQLNATAPQDIKNYLQLAILQAINDQEKNATATLQKAEKLAREQHDQALLDQIQAMRQDISNPMMKMMGSFLQLRGMLDEGDLDEDELDEMMGDIMDMDDEDEPF